MIFPAQSAARGYAPSQRASQQSKLANQARETPRQFIIRESHYLWRRRHLLEVTHQDAKLAKPSVKSLRSGNRTANARGEPKSAEGLGRS